MPELDIDKFIQILHAAGDALRNPATPPAATAPVKPQAQSAYGPHLLSDDQAAAFQLMMNIMGHNGDTVGRGQQIPWGFGPEEKEPVNEKTGNPTVDSPGVRLHSALSGILGAMGAQGLAHDQFNKAVAEALPYTPPLNQTAQNPGNPQGGGRVKAE